jgi:hypothetical protein
MAPPIAPPYQTRPGEDVAQEIALDVVVVLEDEVEARPDQSAEQGGEAHLVGPVDRLAELVQPSPDQGAGADEGERKADPEGLQRERADVDLGEHREERLVQLSE